MTTSGFLAMVCIVAALLLGASGEQCGDQANGTLCPNNLCCSEYGWCGVTPAYCCQNCQSQCNCPSPPPPSPSPPPPTPTPPSPGGGGVADIISASLFEEMLKNRNDPNCPAKGFYTYTAFIAAANSFAGFGTTGDMDIRKREIAAFLGQTSQETTGWWAGQPYAWGYCFKEEINPSYDYCVSNNQWPCVAGQSYHGRGPIQLSYNYNYGPAGKALELDLLSNPSLVSTNPLVSFETAIWFWMTPQYNKPSAHDVIIGRWIPSDNDLRANRLPGYGVITNIINGGLECGHGPDQRVFNRIGYYKRYCDMLGVDYGDNLDCYNQTPFGVGHAEFQQLQTF